MAAADSIIQFMLKCLIEIIFIASPTPIKDKNEQKYDGNSS